MGITPPPGFTARRRGGEDGTEGEGEGEGDQGTSKVGVVIGFGISYGGICAVID